MGVGWKGRGASFPVIVVGTRVIYACQLSVSNSIWSINSSNQLLNDFFLLSRL